MFLFCELDFISQGKANLKPVLTALTGQAQVGESSKEQRRKDTALQLKFRLTCVHVFMGEKAQMKSSFCLVPLNWLSDV